MSAKSNVVLAVRTSKCAELDAEILIKAMVETPKKLKNARFEMCYKFVTQNITKFKCGVQSTPPERRILERSYYDISKNGKVIARHLTATQCNELLNAKIQPSTYARNKKVLNKIYTFKKCDDSELNKSEEIKGLTKTSRKVCTKCRYSQILTQSEVCCMYICIAHQSRHDKKGYCSKFEKKKKIKRTKEIYE